MNNFIISVAASIFAALFIALFPSVRRLAAKAMRWILKFIPDLGRVLPGRLSFTESWNLEAIHGKIIRAKRRLYILQTWFPHFDDEYRTWEQLLDSCKDMGRSFEMKVLLLDPSLYQARLRSRGDLKNLQLEGLNMLTGSRAGKLKKLIRDYRSEAISIDFALINSLPFGPIYCIDDMVHWGLFVSHEDSMNSLHFEAPVQSAAGESILESFDNAWEARSSDLGPERTAAEEGEYRRTVCRQFNDLRRSLRAFKLLGQIKIGSGGVELDAGFASCLEMCLKANVRTIVIMRHAATALNAAGIFSGLLPVSLSEEGGAQIRRLVNAFPRLGVIPWDQIYCSTVARTKETLELILKEARDVIPRRELDERNVGELEGQSKRVVERDPALRDCWKFFFAPEFGESYSQLFLRLRESRFLEELTAPAPRGAQNTLLCTHEGPLKIFRMLFEVSADLLPTELDRIEKVSIDNCDVFVYVDYGTLCGWSESQVEDQAARDLRVCVEDCMTRAKVGASEWLD